MAYVAPNWKNGQAPALDAAALQAISDAIVANQTKNTQQDSSISSLQTAVNGKSRVATGSYTGTGTYGASNPNSITFPFTPKLVWIYGYQNGPQGLLNTINYSWYNSSFCVVIPIYKLTSSYENYYGPAVYASSFTQKFARFTNNTLYWYCTDRYSEGYIYQLNYSGYTYFWIAFG